MRLVVALDGDAASDLDARAASARWCADAIDALDGVAACERAMRDGEDDDDDGCATWTTRANDDDDDALRANGLGAASRGARYVARASATDAKEDALDRPRGARVERTRGTGARARRGARAGRIISGTTRRRRGGARARGKRRGRRGRENGGS